MTTKNFYNAIATNENLSAELREFAANAILKMDKENASRNSKAAEKRTSEDAPLLAQAAELLSDHTVRTAKDIGVALDVSTPKATALMRKLEGVKVSEVTIDKRIVKGYSL